MALVLAVSTLVVSYDAQAQRCRKCGVVEEVDRFQQREPSSSGGAILGAVIGGVLGSQVGSGSGRRAATVAGAVAGGVIGNTPVAIVVANVPCGSSLYGWMTAACAK